MRRAARTDGNHAEVREHLRKLGWAVRDTSAVGHGFPDLLVARAAFTALVEVKDGDKSPSARKLTPDQERFAKTWPGVCIKAESPEDAELQLDLAEKYQYLRRKPGL